MSTFASKVFWLDTIERSVKTVAQTIASLLVADGVIGLLEVNWQVTLSVSGLAGLISVLTSIGSAGSGNSASLVVDAKEK